MNASLHVEITVRLQRAMVPQSFTDWLSRVVAVERPPKTVIAYNVGLFESELGYCAYLTGSTHFDPDDDDWACDEAFTPSERYCDLGRASSDPNDREGVLQEVIDVLTAFLASDFGKRSFLADSQAVTVGFDEGNLFRVR